MANKYTGIRVPKEKLEKLYSQGKTQAEIAELFQVGQQAVQKWFKKLGIKARVAKKRDQRGEKNSSWKGNKADYAALHYRVQTERGRPNFCVMCESKKEKRYEWANMTGVYENVFDYIRLCKSCHSRLDGVYANLTKKHL